MYTFPIMLSVEDPLDFVKDCTAVLFISQLDDIEKARPLAEILIKLKYEQIWAGLPLKMGHLEKEKRGSRSHSRTSFVTYEVTRLLPRSNRDEDDYKTILDSDDFKFLHLNAAEYRFAVENPDNFSKFKDFSHDEWQALLEKAEGSIMFDVDVECGAMTERVASLQRRRPQSPRSPRDGGSLKYEGRKRMSKQRLSALMPDEPISLDRDGAASREEVCSNPPHRSMPPVDGKQNGNASEPNVGAPPRDSVVHPLSFGTAAAAALAVTSSTLGSRLPAVEQQLFGKVGVGPLGSRIKACEKKLFSEEELRQMCLEGKGLKPRLENIEAALRR